MPQSNSCNPLALCNCPGVLWVALAVPVPGTWEERINTGDTLGLNRSKGRMCWLWSLTAGRSGVTAQVPPGVAGDRAMVCLCPRVCSCLLRAATSLPQFQQILVCVSHLAKALRFPGPCAVSQGGCAVPHCCDPPGSNPRGAVMGDAWGEVWCAAAFLPQQ